MDLTRNTNDEMGRPLIHSSSWADDMDAEDPRDRLLSSGGELQEGSVKGGNTSTNAAIFSFACSTVGAGILALPKAADQAGWIGIALLAFVALLAQYTGKLLCACMYAVPGKRLSTYADIGEACYGRKGKLFVTVFQCVTLFGVCTIFLILLGGNMNNLIPDVEAHAWTLICGAAMIPVAWLKTIKEIAILAYIGVAASIIVAAVVIPKGISRASESGLGDEAPTYSVINSDGLAQAFNTIVFSYGGHSVMPTICNAMKKPQEYPQFVNRSYLFITSIYIAIASAGYLGWGGSVEDNILASMDDSWPVTLALAAITLNVFFSYPIPLNPLNLYLEAAWGVDRLPARKELIVRTSMRTVMVVLTIFVASVVPYFGDVLGLVAALSVVSQVFIFPCVFYWKLHHASRPDLLTKFKMGMMALSMLVGVSGSALGTYFSLDSLINNIKEGGNPFDKW